MVLGGLSVKISCQSEHYVQRYSNSNGAMLLKEWHFNCVTLMSRSVCLFITNKILGIHSQFFSQCDRGLNYALYLQISCHSLNLSVNTKVWCTDNREALELSVRIRPAKLKFLKGNVQF